METSVIFCFWSLRALAPTKTAGPAYTDSRPGVAAFETPNPKLHAPKRPRRCCGSASLRREQDARVQVRLNKRFLVFALGQKVGKTRDRRRERAGRFDAAPLRATICISWSY